MAVADVIRLLGVNPLYRNRVVHTEISEPEFPNTEHLKYLLKIPLRRISNNTGYASILTSAMPSTASGPGKT